MNTKYLFIGIILGIIGLVAYSISACFGLFLILFSLCLIVGAFRKQSSPKISGTVTSSRNATPSHRVKKTRKRLEAIGNTDAICPYCQNALEKKPGRKKKCPKCGEFIYVRTRPSDEQKVLVTESQAEMIEEQWAIVNGTHREFLANKKRYENERQRLRKQFGSEPSKDDIQWGLHNQDLIEHASNQRWGSYTNTRLQMGDILRKKSKDTQAISTYLEVCFLDLNGPNNTSRTTMKECPPWEPNACNSEVAPAVITYIVRLMKKMDIDESQVKELFETRASMVKENLQLPLSVSKAWLIIIKEIRFE